MFCVSCLCFVEEEGGGVDAPFDAVGAGEEEAADGGAFGGGVDGLDVGVEAGEGAADDLDAVAWTELNGAGGADAGVGPDDADGYLVDVHLHVGDHGVGAVGAGAGAVAPCEVADPAHQGGDVGGAGAEEEEAGDDGLAASDESPADARGDFFAGIVYVAEQAGAVEGAESVADVVEGYAGAELHGVPLWRVVGKCLCYCAADAARLVGG